ncbi:MAG TPA: hypothetical protein VLK30_02050 [Candidatus Limnocylindrales bacterium]|nr:hypothetical protein [Candidatus Limnocylindrales bacterium]
MGGSSPEIERQIEETRERIDENLTRLEGRAATSAVRVARIAAVAAGVVAVAGIAFLVYRRTRKPTLRDRLDDLSVDELRATVRKLSRRLKDEMPSVTVRVNEQPRREPGVVGSIVRRVAPAIVGTASTAVIERMARPRESASRHTARRAE